MGTGPNGRGAVSATKAAAWDVLGLKFWRQGRRSAKPSPETIRWFVGDLGPSDRCLVVGGTSVGLIRAAAASGGAVTVADFSAQVCDECREAVGDGARVVQADIVDPGTALEPGFTHLLCDTLINRFDGDESRRFAAAAVTLLAPGARLRATVKLGLYDMDRRLLGLVGGPGNAEFWDGDSQTIDYARVGDLMDTGLVAHGSISRADLMAWYRGRGREKRYAEPDLSAMFTGPEWADAKIEVDDEAGQRVRLEAVANGGVRGGE